MVRKQKLLECIDKVSTLHQKDTLVSMETYVSYQVDSGCQVKTYLRFFSFSRKKSSQLALQELNFISQFNFSLVLLDIVALNKTLGESALPGNFFFCNHMYPSLLPRPLALVIQCFSFSILLMICFSFMSSHGTSNIFPRSCSRSVLWLMNVSK